MKTKQQYQCSKCKTFLVPWYNFFKCEKCKIWYSLEPEYRSISYDRYYF